MVTGREFVLRVCSAVAETIRPIEGSLWYEEEDKGKEDAGEDGNEVERPWPADSMRDLAYQHWCEEGSTKERKVRKSHAFATFLLFHLLASCIAET